MSEKRDHVETASQTENEGQEEMMKRFKGKWICVVVMTLERYSSGKKTRRGSGSKPYPVPFSFRTPHSLSASRSSIPCETRVARVIARYTVSFDAKKQWTLDTLCQTWQAQERDVGLIISFSDPSIYYYDTEYVSFVIVIVVILMTGGSSWSKCLSSPVFLRKRSSSRC